ncbi:transglycosylase domain-containing protein [Spirillospora sp. NPDC047279]|uniref:transglycosylase domain-containing protein n=1 Tax=Spirillospora sp. NPDC047279 TaxID=3155478 RepID=UPI0033F999A9
MASRAEAPGRLGGPRTGGQRMGAPGRPGGGPFGRGPGGRGTGGRGPGGPGGRGPGGPGGPNGPNTPREGWQRILLGPGVKREGWRRYLPPWRAVVGVMLLGFAGLCTLVAVAYAQTPTPAEPTVQGVKDQASIFYYAGGKKEIGRIGKKRESVQLGAQGEKPTKGKVPDFVQDSVLAAENRSFRSDRGGISIKGTGRAVYVNLTGGSGGGSTITQQLAKNYYSDVNNRTMSRKFKELFISMKLEEKHSKDEILQLYLNTIYFGRDTYGIQAASREYFGKNVWEIKPDQAAFLGGLIQNPNRDPAEDKNKAWITERYQYTLNGLVTMGKMQSSQADAYKPKLPAIKAAGASGNLFGGQKGYMLMRAKLELERQGIDSKTLTTKGLRVYTTFDARLMAEAQRAAEHAVPQVNPKKLAKKKIRVGLISIDTKNGEVKAFYGGPNYLNQAFDNVWQGKAQAGSAMKPYVLATALEKGYSLKSLVEARSMVPIDTQGNVTPGGVKFKTGHSKPVMDLIEATQWSNNTAYVQLGFKVGYQDVYKMATQAGVASTLLDPHKGGAGMFLGANDIRPVEQAAGYAPFANGGKYHQPHVLKRVLNPDGKTDYKKLKWDNHEVFSADVAAKATYAMRRVVSGGTATAARLPDGREAAGKTGTTDHNVATWFVGYVPQLSTAVTLFNDNFDKQLKRKRSLILPGIGEVQGGTVPATIWREYMSEATKGLDAEPFPQATMDGTVYKWAKPPVKKEEKDDDKPAFCKLPIFKDDPRCKDDNGEDPTDPTDPTDKPACQTPIPDGNCDPNKPPRRPPPDWWCQAHPDLASQYPSCRKQDDDGGDPTQPQTQQRTLFVLPTGRTED